MNAPNPKTPGRDASGRSGGWDKGAVFRVCRMLHAYLSAFAFLALIFFCATGVMLNHPEWFDGYSPPASRTTFMLTPSEMTAARAARDTGPALAGLASTKVRLAGVYASADVDGRQALIRMEGPKGATDLTIDLATGKGEARVTRANLAAVVLDLHRGKNSGLTWRWVIDLSAWIVLGLSLIGYVLFFSLRFRLKTSLILTGASLLVLGVVVWLLVP